MARMATVGESELFDKMHRTIQRTAARNRKRTLYADAEYTLDHFGYKLPDGKDVEQTPMFWPGKSIQVVSSRLKTAGFTSNDAAMLAELEVAFEAAQVKMKEQLAIKSALRHGPAFVFTSAGDESVGEPAVIVSVSSALTATAVMDHRTGIVGAALELLGDRKANLYLPGRVLHVDQRMGKLVVMDEFAAPQRVGCAVYLNDPTVERPMGQSRITRPMMGLTDAGMRNLLRAEVSADWYSYPRERLMGVDPSAFDETPGWMHMIGGIQMLPDIHPDDEPNYPDALRRAEVKTLPQMTMQPFSDQFRLIAAQFSGAASIPPSYLGVVADSNPTSAQAIWAQEVDLVTGVVELHPAFNVGRRALAANVLTAMYGDFDLREMGGLVAHWQDPKTRSPLEQGQFVAQQVQVGNFQAGSRATLDQLPITPESARVIEEENRRAGGAGLLASVLDRAASAPVAQVEVAQSASAVAVEDASAQKAKFEALGMAVRAGVDPDWAASRLGLEGIKLTGAVPVSLRQPESAAAKFEE